MINLESLETNAQIGGGEAFAPLLRELAQSIDDTERQGEPIDEPEGARYVVVSDSCLRMISASIRRAANFLDGTRS